MKPSDAAGTVVGGVMTGLGPLLPWLVALAVVAIVVSFPMPGRGPGFARRDVWRRYQYRAREVVLRRAGGRCEAGQFFGLGRCSEAAVEVDHVFPHSKGGPTVVSNAQALCRDHNRRKRDMTPPWWYVLSLERRRRAYFPSGVDVRVVARVSEAERRARAEWLDKRGGSETQ